MKKLALGLIAAGALVTTAAVPALAQVGVYVGPGGFSVQLGTPGYYYGGPAPYYSGYSGYYAYAPGWHSRYGYYGRHRHYYGHRY
jgi:hypothetical protein